MAKLELEDEVRTILRLKVGFNYGYDMAKVQNVHRLSAPAPSKKRLSSRLLRAVSINFFNRFMLRLQLPLKRPGTLLLRAVFRSFYRLRLWLPPKRHGSREPLKKSFTVSCSGSLLKGPALQHWFQQCIIGLFLKIIYSHFSLKIDTYYFSIDENLLFYFTTKNFCIL